MKRKHFVLIYFFIFLLNSCVLINETKAAADFYEKCLLPKGFGTGKDTAGSEILTPLNRDCQKICTRECEAFSRKFKPYEMLNPNSKYSETYSVELNEDVILNCYSKCQKGGDERFSSYYFDVFQASCEDEKSQDIYQKVCVNRKDYSPAADCTASLPCDKAGILQKGYVSFYKVIQQQKATVGMMCQGNDDENSFNIVETSFEAKENDLLSISLLVGAKDNQLYLCGRKHIEVEPLFYNIGEDKDWYKLNFKNRFSHRFLATISEGKFKNFKDNPKGYWDNNIIQSDFTYSKSDDILTDHELLQDLEKSYGAKQFWKNISGDRYTLKNSIAGWGAKNPNYFHTGINLKNGDILSVIWEGNFSSSKILQFKESSVNDKSINKTKSLLNPNRQNLITECIWNSRVQDKSSCIKQWYENSNLLIQDPQSNSGSSSSSDLVLKGECFRNCGLDNFVVNNSNINGNTSKSQNSNNTCSVPENKRLDNYQCNLKQCPECDFKDCPKDYTKDYCIGKQGALYECGLFGNVSDINLEKGYINGIATLYNNEEVDCRCGCENGDENSQCKDEKYITSGCKNRYSNYNCIEKGNFNAGEGKYVLQGTVDNPNFDSRQPFNLKNYDNDDAQNNSGGYKLSIDWRGCPRSNMDNIQYTIAKKDYFSPRGIKSATNSYKPLASYNNWRDVKEDIVKQGSGANKDEVGFLKINSGAISSECNNKNDCKIFLRIKLEESTDLSVEDNYKYNNTFGQYYINMSKKGEEVMCQKGWMIYKAVKGMKKILVGSDNLGTNSHLNYNIKFNKNDSSVINKSEVGAVGVIFYGFIKQAAYVIKIILALYLVFLAISYILGLVEYTTQVFIKHILKILIVAFLISDTSWNFFGGYLVSFFIDGSIELVARYSASFLQAVSQNQETCANTIIEDPYVIFSIFNGPIGVFTMGDTWSRIWAIINKGLLGFVTAIFLILSIWYYFEAIVKATVMFMFAIIINSILIVTAPVFIVCILFEKTKQMFDSWAKNLFSYALQPVFVYTTIIILNYVVTILIYYIFNFSACSICLVRVDLGPLYNECWVSGYQSMADFHSPPDKSGAVSIYSSFASYAMTFIGGLVIYIVASGMSTFSSHISGVASWIITGAPMRHMSIGKVGDSASQYVKAKVQQAVITAATAVVAVGATAVGVAAGAGGGALAGDVGAVPGAAAGAGAAGAGGTGAVGAGGTGATTTTTANVSSNTASSNVREVIKKGADKIRDKAIDDLLKDDDE